MGLRAFFRFVLLCFAVNEFFMAIKLYRGGGTSKQKCLVGKKSIRLARCNGTKFIELQLIKLEESLNELLKITLVLIFIFIFNNIRCVSSTLRPHSGQMETFKRRHVVKYLFSYSYTIYACLGNTTILSFISIDSCDWFFICCRTHVVRVCLYILISTKYFPFNMPTIESMFSNRAVMNDETNEWWQMNFESSNRFDRHITNGLSLTHSFLKKTKTVFFFIFCIFRVFLLFTYARTLLYSHGHRQIGNASLLPLPNTNKRICSNDYDVKHKHVCH